MQRNVDYSEPSALTVRPPSAFESQLQPGQKASAPQAPERDKSRVDVQSRQHRVSSQGSSDERAIQFSYDTSVSTEQGEISTRDADSLDPSPQPQNVVRDEYLLAYMRPRPQPEETSLRKLAKDSTHVVTPSFSKPPPFAKPSSPPPAPPVDSTNIIFRANDGTSTPIARTELKRIGACKLLKIPVESLTTSSPKGSQVSIDIPQLDGDQLDAIRRFGAGERMVECAATSDMRKVCFMYGRAFDAAMKIDSFRMEYAVQPQWRTLVAERLILDTAEEQKSGHRDVAYVLAALTKRIKDDKLGVSGDFEKRLEVNPSAFASEEKLTEFIKTLTKRLEQAGCMYVSIKPVYDKAPYRSRTPLNKVLARTQSPTLLHVDIVCYVTAMRRYSKS